MWSHLSRRKTEAIHVSDHEHPRRDDGKIAEHWEALRPVPTKSRPRAERRRVLHAAVTLGSSMQKTKQGANNTMATNANNNLEQNKQSALDFFDLHVNQSKSEEAAEKYLGSYYIQHDAQAPDGREGFLEISKVARSQHPQLHQDVKRITADGDLVMAHSLITLSPEDRGTAVVDILRFEDGKIVEHWDVRQPMPAATANGNPFI
jgi:predicted SnoaL-like aldol condensation-catalyzing enzyme